MAVIGEIDSTRGGETKRGNKERTKEKAKKGKERKTKEKEKYRRDESQKRIPNLLSLLSLQDVKRGVSAGNEIFERVKSELSHLIGMS